MDESNELLSQYLKEWGLDEPTIKNFEDNQITFDLIKNIKDAELKELIPSLRHRIMFRNGLDKLQYIIHDTASEDTISLASSVCSSSISGSSGAGESEKKYKIDLNKILEKNNSGELCLAALKKNHKLDPTSRGHLVKSVVEYYLKEFGVMKREDFEEIVSQILILVPTEEKVLVAIIKIQYSDDENERRAADWADPGVTMRNVARRLRALEIEELDGEGAGDPVPDHASGAASPPDPSRDEPLLDSFSWSENFDTYSGHEEVYSREPGPTTASFDPLEIFLLMWDVSILRQIVEQTNLYAWQTISALSEHGSIPKYLDTWVETTIEEVRRLLAMMMLMSLDYRSRVKDYWIIDPMLEMTGFRDLMSRNRYQILMRFLHFTDNSELPIRATSYQKKLAKISDLFEKVQKKFTELYTPNRELSLDETLLLWKGRLNWVQCIRSKAARFGINSFELCESSTGCLLKSILYAGKDSTFVEGPLHGFSSKTSKVVLELMDGYLDVGHLVVMDNWYNQLPLTRFLKFRKTDVLGTLKKNRTFVPEDIKNLNVKRMTRGQQVAQHCGDIAITAWRDKKLVTVLSTCHNSEQVVGRRGGQDILKPIAVEAYNKTMGGVDLKDTKLSHYPMERKRGRKWYFKVFARLLNTTILNSFVIYKHNAVANMSEPRRVLNHRQFRVALARALVQSSTGFRVPALVTAATPGQWACRLDNMPDHYPVHTAGAATNKKEKYVRKRCKRCTALGVRSEVNTMCSKCKVALCVDKCWIEYHTLDTL